MLLWATNSVDTQKLNNINTSFDLMNQSSPYFREINAFKQKPEETASPDYFLPIMRHVYGFLSIWDALSWRGLESLVTLRGNFTAAHCVNILWIIYILLSKLYFHENAHFIMTTRLLSILLKWSKSTFKSMRKQMADLSNNEHLRVYLESKLRSRFPPSSTLLELENTLIKNNFTFF